MEDKVMKRRMTVLSVAVILMCTLYSAYLIMYFTASVCPDWDYGAKVVWTEGIMAMQAFVLSGKVFGQLALGVMVCVFMVRSVKLMGSGEVFSRANLKLLRAAAAVYCLYAVCAENVRVLYAEDRYFTLSFETVLAVLMIVAAVMLYGMGVKLSEDNRLVI